MFQSVTLPLWLLVVILAFAAVTFASHFLFPSVRWFFRRRAERVIAKLNTRLARPIEPFKLARRHDTIQRLIYDPQVTEAIVEHSRENGVPENVAFEQAQRYAREIVPSFSATAYFTFGSRAARWLSKALYRIQLGEFDRDTFDHIDRDATLIFVMNHRSNMDYVLVTWLVSRASALSYAVGEWARVWPLSAVIRMMGAYFIQRRSRGQLYRKVLARYVQMATRGGVTQAIFPEGGLSLTGAPSAPKLGLLSYVVEEHDTSGRDVVFVPVAMNYDHVLEDEILIRAGRAGTRRFRPPILRALWGLVRYVFRFLTFRWRPYGTASVAFGEPLSLRQFTFDHPGTETEAVARALMERIRGAVPVLPVPAVASVLVQGEAVSRAELERRVRDVLERAAAAGAPVPRRNVKSVTEDGLDILQRRKLVRIGSEVRMTAEAAPILDYYANSIRHHLVDDAPMAWIAATAKQ